MAVFVCMCCRGIRIDCFIFDSRSRTIFITCVAEFIVCTAFARATLETKNKKTNENPSSSTAKKLKLNLVSQRDGWVCECTVCLPHNVSEENDFHIYIRCSRSRWSIFGSVAGPFSSLPILILFFFLRWKHFCAPDSPQPSNVSFISISQLSRLHAIIINFICSSRFNHTRFPVAIETKKKRKSRENSYQFYSLFRLIINVFQTIAESYLFILFLYTLHTHSSSWMLCLNHVLFHRGWDIHASSRSSELT